jgi:hypothetical protein
MKQRWGRRKKSEGRRSQTDMCGPHPRHAKPLVKPERGYKKTYSIYEGCQIPSFADR